MPGSLVTFVCSGIPAERIRYGKFSLSRGVTPSVISLLIVPINDLALADSTVGIDDGATHLQFAHCALASANIHRREVRGETLWAVHLYDRRWKWNFGSISGEYNKRNPDGTLDVLTPGNARSAWELMATCLTVMGEIGADVSRVPTNVYPYVKWNGIKPALALADLCERTACEVVLSAADNVEIWRSGQGASTIDRNTQLHQKYRFLRQSIPGVIDAVGEPSLYQGRLKMRAVGRDVNSTQELVNLLSYSPAQDWTKQSLLSFQGVTGATTSPLAMETIWRQYKVVGQENGALAVPGCSEAVTSVNQYVLQDKLLSYEIDIDGFVRLLPPYIDGDYWAYTDLPNNVTSTRYVGPWKLYNDRRLVEFPFPVVKMTSAGLPTEPSLYLNAAYQVKSVSGDPVRVKRSQLAGGSGGRLTIKVPGVLASYTSTGNTEAQANAELDNYLELFANKYSARYASELTYAGIYPITPDGIISQVTWEAGFARPPKTMACEWEELDRTALSYAERRRREKLESLLQ